jgi:hypothetical protein
MEGKLESGIIIKIFRKKIDTHIEYKYIYLVHLFLAFSPIITAISVG